MHAQIRRAVPLLGHKKLVGNLPGIAHPVQVGAGSEGLPSQNFLDADAPQHLHRVGHQLNARPHGKNSRGLLVDLNVDAHLPQGGGSGQTADARPDDGNGKLVLQNYFHLCCLHPYWGSL